MEPSGVLQEAIWSKLDATVPSESEIMAQLFGTYHSPYDQDHSDPSCSVENGNSSLTVHHWSHGYDSSAGSFSAHHVVYDSYYQNESNMVPEIDASSTLMNYWMVGDQILDPWVTPISPVGDPTFLNDETISDEIGDSRVNTSETAAPQNQMLPKRKYHASKDDISSKCSKRPRVSNNITKSMKRGKRSQKSTRSSDEEDSNTIMQCLNSCSFSSEDDSNARRKREDQGPSTTSQSLYARKRRERINERLRILQNLVPNGTKVDISTMLEEAVNYVKFLQLQIKLLSSDELWIYAPIAYNGINIGLDLEISQVQQH